MHREVTPREKLRAYMTRNGFFRTALWLMGKSAVRVAKIVYQAADYNLAVIYLEHREVLDTASEESIRCKVIDGHDVEDLERLLGPERTVSFGHRINTSRGYIARCNGKVAGYGWATHLALKGEGIKPFFIDIYPHERNVYVYDCFTLPEYRNQKAFTTLLKYMLSDLKQEGFRKVFLSFNVKNEPMRAVMEKMGFQIEGQTSARKYLWIIRRDVTALEKVCRVNW